MTDVPEWLFLVASTALVLGVAIALRGILMFRPVAELPQGAGPTGVDPTGAPVADDGPASDPDGAEAAMSESTSAATPVVTGPRDLKEPMIMTLAGLIIAVCSAAALQALITSG